MSAGLSSSFPTPQTRSLGAPRILKKARDQGAQIVVNTRTGEFSAEVARDAALACDVVELHYHAPSAGGDIVARIAPERGSNLVGLRVGQHELIHTEPEMVRDHGWTGCFVIWPLPNRIRDKHYMYRGSEYCIEGVDRPGGDPHLVHGLVLDRPWEMDDPYVDSEEASLRTAVTIATQDPLFAAYPFPSTFSLNFRLRAGGLTVEYDVINQGTTPLPHGLALHPYFRALSGPDATRVRLPARAVMEAEPSLLPTGRLLPVDSIMWGPFDLREPRATGSLRLDHVYTDWDPGEGVRIDYPAQDFSVLGTASREFTHAVIFTLGSRDWFCLEHQVGSTDAVNLAAQGRQNVARLVEVAPGGTMRGWIRYGIEWT
jgi:aldose 1-epimerase